MLSGFFFSYVFTTGEAHKSRFLLFCCSFYSKKEQQKETKKNVTESNQTKIQLLCLLKKH